MTTQAEQITALATRVGTECKTLRAEITAVDGDVKTLQTTVQGLPQINDTTASATSLYSSSKVDSQITAAKQAVKNDLLGGAGEAFDTLKELADLIANNQDAIEAINTLAAGHVKFDGAQSLTVEQQQQARTNIGALGSADITAVTNTANTAKSTADSALAKANSNETAIGSLNTTVGGHTTKIGTLETDVSNLQAKDGTQDTAITKAQTDATNAGSAASKANNDLTTLKTALGDLTTDYVAAFNIALVAA